MSSPCRRFFCVALDFLSVAFCRTENMGKRGENEECFDPFGIGHSGLFHVKPIGFLIFEHRFNPEPTMIPRDPSSCPFERGNEQERFLSVWTPGDGHIHEKRTGLGDGDARVITGFALRKKAE